MTKHTPATPLTDAEILYPGGGICMVRPEFAKKLEADRTKLIEALRYFTANMDPNGEWVKQSTTSKALAFEEARNVLRELGETK